MPDKNHEVYTQAKAFVDSIAKLTAKERGETPPAHFGQQYNRLREMAMELKPDIDPRSWPPAINVITSGFTGASYSQAKYVDIATYARTILGHFS